ncbi:MAG: nitrilase-related carbon-nitrogen hydrolase [Candidatus Thorarchaeota archaeon]
MEFSVCLVQMPCVEGDRKPNFERARWLLQNHEPRTEREFVVLPELFAIGFRHTDYATVGPGVNGETEDFLHDLAAETGTYVVTTDIEEHGEKYFNTLMMASPQGKTIAKYRKVHPFQQERDVFDGGDTLVLATVKGMKVGLEICYDIRFPELTRRLALEGAQLVIVPGAFPDPRSHHWDTLLLARAIENQLYVAAANRVGRSFDGKTYFGHSQFVDPWGVRATRMNSEERVIRDTGDTNAVESARAQITCYEDRVPGAYERVRHHNDQGTSVK